jgi:hypothetical protein
MLLAEHGIDNSGVSPSTFPCPAFFDASLLSDVSRQGSSSATKSQLSFLKTRLLLTLFCLQAGVYFDEITGGPGGTTRYVPRSVQVDLEAGVCNKV